MPCRVEVSFQGCGAHRRSCLAPWPVGVNPDGAPGLSPDGNCLNDMASPLSCQNRADSDGPESNRANQFCSSADKQTREKILALVLEAVATLPAFQRLVCRREGIQRETNLVRLGVDLVTVLEPLDLATPDLAFPEF